MDEDNRLASIKFLLYRNEVGVTKVVIALSVARHKDNTVCLKLIQGISDLGKAKLGVKQGWHTGEETIVLWVCVTHACGILVELAREGCGLMRVRLDLRAGGCMAQNGCFDSDALTQIAIALNVPFRHVPSRRIAAFLFESCEYKSATCFY
jgi:hypothetical protein